MATKEILAQLAISYAEEIVAIYEVLNSLGDDCIDPRTAPPGWEGRRDPVGSDEPLRALDDPGFEERFGVPEGINLKAETEVAQAIVSAMDVAPQGAEENPKALATAKTRPLLERVPPEEDYDDSGEHEPVKQGSLSELKVAVLQRFIEQGAERRSRRTKL